MHFANEDLSTGHWLRLLKLQRHRWANVFGDGAQTGHCNPQSWRHGLTRANVNPTRYLPE